MDAVASSGGQPAPWRISDVVQRTGLSKELVHHYLRQGLLPRSRRRGRYSDNQVRLLRQIRALREDHHLPLEVIGRLLATFEFDAGRIESLTLCDSLGKRITDFAARGDLADGRTLTAAELAREAGVDAQRATELIEVGLVTPSGEPGEPRFSSYDARVIALCERGMEQGIAFEAFRTIASYVRIAFDLAHQVFYDVPPPGAADAERVLADLFVRRELASGFVQMVLLALTQQRLRALLDQPRAERIGLGEIVYRPSELFVRAHGLDELVERARDRVRLAPDDAQLRLQVAELLLHAGRHDEAAFLLAESFASHPQHHRLRLAYARAAVLVGDSERGAALLEPLLAADEPPAGAAVLGALVAYGRAHADGRPEALIRDAVPIVRGAERALGATAAAHTAADIEVRVLAAWLLTAMPPVFIEPGRGLAVLVRSYRALEIGARVDDALPGMIDRLRIQCAYLLLDAIERTDGAAPQGPGAGGIDCAERFPSRGELSAAICRLDPASTFAESAYLAGLDAEPLAKREP